MQMKLRTLMHRARTDKRYAIGFVAAALLVSLAMIVGGLFVARGPIRQDVIPGYFSWRHKKEVREVFDHNVRAINAAYAPFGLKLTEQHYRKTCHMMFASDIRESVTCGAQATGKLTLTDQPSETRYTQLMAAKAFLEKQGWHENTQLQSMQYAEYGSYSFDMRKGNLLCQMSLTYTYDGSGDVSLDCFRSFTFIGEPETT